MTNHTDSIPADALRRAQFEADVERYIAVHWPAEFPDASCTRRAQIRRQAREALMSGPFAAGVLDG